MWHRWLWVWALCLVAGVSHAQGPSVVWDSHSGYGYSNSPGKVTVTAAKYEAKSADFARLLMGRSYTPGGTAEHSIMRDLMSKPSNLFGGANPLPAALERQVTVKAVARGAFRMVPIVGTAMMISDAIDMLETSGCKLDLDAAEFRCNAATETITVPTGSYRYLVWSGSGQMYDSMDGLVAWWVRANACSGSFRCALSANPPSSWDEEGLGWMTGTMSEISEYKLKDGVLGWHVVAPGGPVTPVRVRRIQGSGPAEHCTGEWDSNGNCSKPGSEDDVAGNVPESAGNAARAPGVMDWMDQNGGKYETGNPRIVDLPPSISGGRYETTNNPDGSTTTKDRDYLLRTSPSPSPAPTIIVDIRDTVTNWPSGRTPDPAPEPGTRAAPPVTAPAGGSQGTTTTSNGGGSGETVVEVKSCGLPDTPPCKIDESGTPEWDAKDGSADAGGIFAALGACLADISSCVPALPDLSWSFSLPSSCAAIPTPGFEPFLSEVNICPYQPTIHDLMSMVWAAAGLFAGIAMVGRDARASI